MAPLSLLLFSTFDRCVPCSRPLSSIWMLFATGACCSSGCWLPWFSDCWAWNLMASVCVQVWRYYFLGKGILVWSTQDRLTFNGLKKITLDSDGVHTWFTYLWSFSTKPNFYIYTLKVSWEIYWFLYGSWWGWLLMETKNNCKLVLTRVGRKTGVM